MQSLVGKSSSGRLFTLGREAIGQFVGKITQVEQALNLSKYHFASFSDATCDNLVGGERFTASCCELVVGMIKENIATGGARLPVQWPALSPVYDTLKREYAPDKGQWDLSGTIFNSIGVQKRRMEAGRSVGILYNTPVTRINYSIMRGEAGGFSIRKYRETGEKIKLKRTKVRPSTYAFWNEFGTRATQYSGGQPPRPLFTPTFFQFTKDHLPELTKAIRASLLEDFKRLSRNLAKTSGIGGVGYAGKLGKGHKRGALPGVKLGGEISTFIYEDKFAEVAGLKMRETGAIKWRRGGPEKK